MTTRTGEEFEPTNKKQRRVLFFITLRTCLPTTPSKMEGNKKKRKISELINIYEVSQAPLPPPLDLPADLADSSLESEGSPAKRAKFAENITDPIELPPLPADAQTASRRKLKTQSSKPRLSSLSTSERRLRERQRGEAANEILTSERNYVSSLESFMTVRLKTSVFHGGVSVGSLWLLHPRFYSATRLNHRHSAHSLLMFHYSIGIAAQFCNKLITDRKIDVFLALCLSPVRCQVRLDFGGR